MGRDHDKSNLQTRTVACAMHDRPVQLESESPCAHFPPRTATSNFGIQTSRCFRLRAKKRGGLPSSWRYPEPRASGSQWRDSAARRRARCASCGVFEPQLTALAARITRYRCLDIEPSESNTVQQLESRHRFGLNAVARARIARRLSALLPRKRAHARDLPDSSRRCRSRVDSRAAPDLCLLTLQTKQKCRCSRARAKLRASQRDAFPRSCRAVCLARVCAVRGRARGARE